MKNFSLTKQDEMAEKLKSNEIDIQYLTVAILHGVAIVIMLILLIYQIVSL